MLSFGPSRWRWLVEGASQEEIETAFAAGKCSHPSRRTPRAWAGRSPRPRRGG